MKIEDKYFSADEGMNANQIEDMLQGDEKILWRDKPNKKSYILSAVFKMLPIVLIWTAIDAVFIVALFKFDLPKMVYYIAIPFFILHLAPVWIWIANLVRSAAEIKNIEYAFTEKRIIIRSGVIGIDVKSIYYTDLVGVNVRVGLLDRMLKVGDIYIKSTMQAQVLYDIKNPYFIGDRLQKIALDIKADISFPNAYRPDSNPGYHTGYHSDDDAEEGGSRPGT